MEMCRTAQNTRDCIAFKFEEEVTADDLTELCKLVPLGTAIIVWIDYVETQECFDEILKRAISHNVHDDLSIRLIANCRTSYYKTELSDNYRLVIDVAPNESPVASEAYRREVFAHIIQKAGFSPSDRFAADCGYNPVLAAFILYIAVRGSEDPDLIPDLRDLARCVTHVSGMNCHPSLRKGNIETDSIIWSRRAIRFRHSEIHSEILFPARSIDSRSGGHAASASLRVPVPFVRLA